MLHINLIYGRTASILCGRLIPIDAPVGTSRVHRVSQNVHLNSFTYMDACKHTWLSSLLVRCIEG